MSARYYLACSSCGHRLVVEPAQAGETLDCACGAKVEAPTLVGLKKLPPVKELAEEEPPPRWSVTQTVIFTVGLLLTLALLTFMAYAAYRWLSITDTEKPVFDSIRIEGVVIGPHAEDEGLEKVHYYWTLLARELPEHPPEYAYVRNRAEASTWFWATVGGLLAAIAGTAVMASAIFLSFREGGGGGR
jgi:hypothetical protein